jgi:hypothetical protein
MVNWSRIRALKLQYFSRFTIIYLQPLNSYTESQTAPQLVVQFLPDAFFVQTSSQQVPSAESPDYPRQLLFWQPT